MPHQSLVRNEYKQKINPSRPNPRRREKIDLKFLFQY